MISKINTGFDFCFVLSDLLSTTPRAHRAIKTILKEGYSVCLVYNKRIKHAVAYNDELINELSSPQFYAEGIEWRKNNLRVIWFKALSKLGIGLYKIFRFKNPFLWLILNDYTTFWQKRQCRKVKAKVYVGHRPSVLPVIADLAKRHKGHAWFDIEDHHFEESIDEATNRFMHDFIPQFPVSYFTNASALIGSAFTKKLGFADPGLEILNAPCLKNFDLERLEAPTNTLTFIWFSQYVTFNRGLELFFHALESHNHSTQFRINLVGLADPLFRDYVNNLTLLNSEVIFHGFKTEREILELAIQSDVGLALELPTVDKSRNLAITNKILAYAVCGNYIIATRTKGQIYFMNQLPKNGILVDPVFEDFEKLLENKEVFDLSLIRGMRQKRIENAKKVDWQAQEKKLLRFFNNILGGK